MWVGVDANISVRIVQALSALYSTSRFQQVGTGPAGSDAPWIAEFAKRGGQGVLGLDRQILAKPHEVSALQTSGLAACFFDFGRAQVPKLQAAAIIYLWPSIERRWEDSPGTILRVKATPNLSAIKLETLEFWLEAGVPRVRRRED